MKTLTELRATLEKKWSQVAELQADIQRLVKQSGAMVDELEKAHGGIDIAKQEYIDACNAWHDEKERSQ